MAGYIRQDTSDQISPDSDINAEPLDAEFDALQLAFSSSNGHRHNGQVGEGPPITMVGPIQDVTISSSSVSPKTNNTVNLGTSVNRFKDLFISGTANLTKVSSADVSITGGTISGITDLAVADGGTGASTQAGARTNLGLGTISTQNADSVNLDGGTIDGTSIGTTTAGTGRFSTLSATGNLSVSGTTSLTGTLTASGGVTGNLTGNVTGNLSGNASTADRWTVTRTLTLSGGATGSVNFNGSGNMSLAVSVVPSQHIHTLAQISDSGTIASQNSNSVSITGGSISGITDLAVADGGTGASTAANARTNLGLGTLSTANTINNSNWSGTALAVANGGTGSTTASAARTALGAASTSVATTSANGLMSSSDKTKLNGIATGATADSGVSTQSVWTDGSDSSRYVISPLELHTKLNNYRNTSEIGWGQSWLDVSASRVSGTSYRNTTTSPIMVAAITSGNGDRTWQVSSNNSTWFDVGKAQRLEARHSVSFIVPLNWYYRINDTGGNIESWVELR